MNDPPRIESAFRTFVDEGEVSIGTERERVEVHYTLDGTPPTVISPTAKGPIKLTRTTTIAARSFREGKPVSGTEIAIFTRVEPLRAVDVPGLTPGIQYRYYEGDWDVLPQFSNLTPVKEGTLPNVDFSPRIQVERSGFVYSGFIRVDDDDVYAFFTSSDDGSRLYVGDSLVVDNDGLHSLQEKRGEIALAKGMHPFQIAFFEKTGNDELTVSVMSKRMKKQPLPASMLYRKH